MSRARALPNGDKPVMTPKSLIRSFATLALALPVLASAQSSAPIRIVVPFQPGGGSDLFARLIVPGLSAALKRNVIVDNRAGAGGVIGTDLVAKSAPNGDTLLVSDSAAYTISPYLYTTLPYAQKDLLPVAELGRFANVLLVPANSPYHTLKDLLAAAKKDPGALTIGSAGNGSITHLTAERFQREAGIKLVHVPYKGSGPAIADTMSGQVQMVFSGLPSVSEYLKGGKLRALAIASNARSAFAPEVPTFTEAGLPGMESLISQGLFAPAAMSPALAAQINAAVNQYMASKELAPRLEQLKVEPSRDGPAQYKAWLDNEAKAWSQLIKEANIRIE